MNKISVVNLDEARKYLRHKSDNCFQGEGVAESFKDINKDFGIYCRVCGSTNILFIGKDGIDYGEQTGYCGGSNVIKCKDCGNAVEFYK